MFDKKFEKNLSDEVCNQIVMNMQRGVACYRVIVNSAGKPADYVFVETNPAFEKLMSLPKDRIIGKKINEVFSGAEKDSFDWISTLEKVAETLEPASFENFSNSMQKWFAVSAFCPAESLLVTIFEDITQNKRTEEQLRSASLYARSLIEASLDPLVTISAAGKITDVNRSTEEVTGLSRDKLVGDDFSDYFTEPEKAREGYQKVLAEGFVRDYPLTIRHASGRTTDVLYNATVYKNEAGEVQGIFAAARDVTERKKAEEALQKGDEIISKLSTPLVGIGEGIVMVPVIGILDSTRARQLTESVLEHIARSNTEMVVMDISGIFAIDTKTANYILRTVQAVKLMGSEFVITGIRPDVAATLVTLGVDLAGVITRGSLQEGLEYAYAKLGFRLMKVGQG